MGAPCLKNQYAMFKKLVCQWVKQLEILSLPCLHILPLITLLSIIGNFFFQTHLSIHNINTRYKHHLHRPNANLSYVHKTTVYAGIKNFNTLPPSVTIVKNDKAKFITALRKHYIHIPFTLQMNFFMTYSIIFVKDLILFYTVILFATLTEVFATLTEVFATLTEVFATLTEVFATLTEVFATLTEVYATLTEVLPCFLLSCKANATV